MRDVSDRVCLPAPYFQHVEGVSSQYRISDISLGFDSIMTFDGQMTVEKLFFMFCVAEILHSNERRPN
jgi:hypothetical protein